VNIQRHAPVVLYPQEGTGTHRTAKMEKGHFTKLFFNTFTLLLPMKYHLSEEFFRRKFRENEFFIFCV